MANHQQQVPFTVCPVSIFYKEFSRLLTIKPTPTLDQIENMSQNVHPEA